MEQAASGELKLEKLLSKRTLTKEYDTPEEKEKVERIVIEEMQKAFPLSVPLVADSGFGKNWLEAH